MTFLEEPPLAARGVPRKKLVYQKFSKISTRVETGGSAPTGDLLKGKGEK